MQPIRKNLLFTFVVSAYLAAGFLATERVQGSARTVSGTMPSATPSPMKTVKPRPIQSPRPRMSNSTTVNPAGNRLRKSPTSSGDQPELQRNTRKAARSVNRTRPTPKGILPYMEQSNRSKAKPK